MKVAAVGDNCMDVYDKQNRFSPGGNPVNVAVYLRRMGVESSYTGVVGSDEYGRMMVEAIRSRGVDTSHLRAVPGSTAITHVDLVDGERVFGDYDEGVLAGFKLAPEDIDFLCSHDMVVSGLWGKIEGDLPAMKTKGATVVFDFATKLDDPVVEKAIGHVDYAFFAYDHGDDRFIREYIARMQARGPRVAVATLGDKGSVAYDGRDYTAFGIVPCEVKDTMGAGDSYIAGFIAGVLRGESLADCMRRGAESASVTLQYAGAW
jgi:fructoselysine 6-kinase